MATATNGGTAMPARAMAASASALPPTRAAIPASSSGSIRSCGMTKSGAATALLEVQFGDVLEAAHDVVGRDAELHERARRRAREGLQQRVTREEGGELLGALVTLEASRAVPTAVAATAWWKSRSSTERLSTSIATFGSDVRKWNLRVARVVLK